MVPKVPFGIGRLFIGWYPSEADNRVIWIQARSRFDNLGNYRDFGNSGNRFDSHTRAYKIEEQSPCHCVREVLRRISLPKWRNWQTRMVQVHVPARVWGFESLLRHQNFFGFSLIRTPRTWC